MKSFPDPPHPNKAPPMWRGHGQGMWVLHFLIQGHAPKEKGFLRSVSYSVVLVAMGIGVGIGEGLLSPGKPGIVTIAWSSCLSLTLAVRFYGMLNMMRYSSQVT